MSFNKYLLLLFSYSLALGALMFLLQQSVFNRLLLVEGTLSILFFICFNAVSHYLITKSISKKPRSFVQAFMGTVTVKMMLSLGIIVIYALFNKENAILFISSFAGLYLGFTAFEVVILMQKLKK